MTGIEPVQESNKWEIASAGWPGGDVAIFDKPTENTGYPQNMNFWTDDGNLKSFAVFPQKEVKRLSGDPKLLNLSGFSAEDVHFAKSSHQAGPTSSWGGKVFVVTGVDPKTHWLPVRPDWEIHHQKQYYRFTAGQTGQENGWGDADKKDWPFAEIGPSVENGHPHGNSHLRKTLNDRPVYILSLIHI